MKNIFAYKLSVLLLLAFTLQSCFVAKNYDRPDLHEIDRLYRTDHVATDSALTAVLSWKELFTDPLLSEYIEDGLQNNLDIRIALQQIAAAESYMKQGKMGYLPSLDAKASMTHQELAPNSQFGSFFSGSIEQFELTGNLSWEADIWGKIRSNQRATQASYLQSMAAHQAVKTRLISQIASNYYLLLALEQQHKITEETIENRKKSLQTIQALKEAGNVTQVAVDQTAAQLYNAQALLIDIEKNIFRTENAFAILLGKPATHIDRSYLGNQTLTRDLNIGLPAHLLANRPDVLAAEFRLMNTFELTNVAKSSFYPSLTLTGTGGLQSLEFKEWFSSGSLFATLVGGITQPIFNKRRIRTQYEVAKAQQEEFRQNEVESLRKAELNSEILLNNGFGTYLDLLTARQNALNAELNTIDNKLQQLQAVVELYRALGGGWK